MSNCHITSEEDLRALMGEPIHEIIMAKSAPSITQPMQTYIEQSPFVCLATHDPDGASDVSPRGDAPGFVQVLNDKTLVVPERPGNKRLDSIINIINQPQLALLFMIPSVLETLRVNGRGIVSTDPELRQRCEVRGKLPELVVVVTVEEAFGHCPSPFNKRT